MTQESSVTQDAALLESIDTSSAMNLHKSNLMRMQVAELLDECQLDLQSRKWASNANEYLQMLSRLVPKTVFKVEKLKDKADKPISIEIRRDNPLTVEPIGLTKTPIAWTKKSGNAQVLPTFDLCVKIPEASISKKDYMNHRYIDKRKCVIEQVTNFLSKNSEKVGSIHYLWLKGSNRAPVLRLVPPNERKSPKFQVHLHFGMHSIDWIPKLRLVPNRSNVKAEFPSFETQQYNHVIMFDARHQFEDKHLSTLVDLENIQASLVLVQVWALQRGLWRNHDGWTKECFALLLVYLLRTHKINTRMTPIQLITVLFQTLSEIQWLGEEAVEHTNIRAAERQVSRTDNHAQRRRAVLVLPTEGVSEKETIRQSALGRLYEQQTRDSPLTENDPRTLLDAYASVDSYHLGPVFLDSTLSYNFLGDVSPNYTRLLQAHARRSLTSLKQPRVAFSFLFMRPMRFWNHWDLYVRIPMDKSKEWESHCRKLVHLLEAALGNRIRGLRVLSTGNGDENDGKGGDAYLARHTKNEDVSSMPLGFQSPTGQPNIELGISINPETSQRVVDRGPSAEESAELQTFKDLWGDKAQLRRFKDGAIVHAVVWNDTDATTFRNDSTFRGGYVEKIIAYIVGKHFTNAPIQFSLPDLMSVVDGASSDEPSIPFADPVASHQKVMSAFNSLSDFLQKSSRLHDDTGYNLGLPLAIDAVEPLSPSLRYSELFPPVPHPLLGGEKLKTKKIPGALTSEPILIQIRFSASSKWPNDLKAIGAAKTAMLIQLAEGIESSSHEGFAGSVFVNSSYAEVGYMGFCFRIMVRADPEIRMLQGLAQPSVQAMKLLDDYTKKHVMAATHHSTIHAVHTLHPSAGSVVRMAKRWLASHMLSDLMTIESIELLVAKVYSKDEALLGVPATVQAGFLAFLHLLGNHNWARDPLIVDPRCHIDNDHYDAINAVFEDIRGDMDDGPAMYIVAPYTRLSSGDSNVGNDSEWGSWQPSCTSPEWVVLRRAVALARRSHEFLMSCLRNFKESDACSIFRESATGFKSYNVLFRVHPDFNFDINSSSTSEALGNSENDDGIVESAYTRSMKARYDGPKALGRKIYRNLDANMEEPLCTSWRPVSDLVSSLREIFGHQALIFYNDLSPEVIALLWRPATFESTSFSVMTSDHAKPVGFAWDDNKSVMRSEQDLLREISQYNQEMVTSVKVMNCEPSSTKKRKIIK
mmetsp:Transcript_14570/g.35207  ORF Transcript_14570/g.35207 Transcript_14570/m.35207 type:complete len:1208 (+) Transcript_14570:97-3720(+)|eukprot:CAMPEP_0113626482 /NCGR_PEP_ID=MMETSP0017_2-20120614/13696_1 /TAXON_ID=2856 /ORGANISM="Cylindrotheca closterium" /LENGTH=1207 /DNA_ID=CAMNT_0000536665 /DNA_START=38 /DNA_END=3661 /DNA_ORIENTATION=- /assembly_acc=CAM_ASM_000147